METKHTPTPWEIRPAHDNQIQRANPPAGMGKAIAACAHNYDAEFIVRAANCHDELVKQLQDMYDFIIDRDFADEESDGMKQAAAILAKAGAQ